MAKDIVAVLKNFIRHVTNLKAEDDPAGTGMHREFRMLREAQIQNKNEDRFPTEDGRKDENVKKNRYKDILPRDDRRVKLNQIPGQKGSDYINATFLLDAHKEYGYIAAQGPMPNTVSDFWRMLWEYNTEIVFMVCRIKEDGRPKCEKYWADLNQSTTFGDITAYTDIEEEVQDHFIRRQFRVVKNGETHHMTHFHYTGWPDHNTPSSPDALRKMIEEVRNYRKKLKIPMVVHCSAGCGRTGTICAIDYAWTLLDEGMIEEEFSMFEIIKHMREQRMSMVQTPDQYEYTHMVMKSLCNEWLTSFTDHDYVNVTLKADPPEENYCNINFQADDAPSSENVVVVSTSSKEPLKPLKKASDKPDIKHQKPVVRHQKAEVKTPSPEVMKIKKHAGPIASIAATSHAKNFHMENTSSQEVDAGEYIEVRQTATVPANTFSSIPPSLPNKKNPPPDTASLDPQKLDAQKTKQRAPKAPTAQGMKGSPGSSGGQPVPSDALYMEVAKTASSTLPRPASLPAYENFQLPVPKRRKPPDHSAARPTSDETSNSAQGGVPELPQRNYKPEEVRATTTTTITSHTINSTVAPAASKDSPHKPNYDNVIIPLSNQQQQQARPAPTSRQDQPRGWQPTPKAAQTHTVFTHPVQSSPQPYHRHAGGHPTITHSGQPGRPAGMVSAMGGGGGHQVVPVRHRAGGGDHVWMQQTIFPAPNRDPRHGPVVMKTQSAGNPPSNPGSSVNESKGFFKQIFKGVMKSHSQPAQVPAPGQIIVANKGKRVFLTEHPQRVRGPRPLPQGWTTFSKNHRGTFL